MKQAFGVLLTIAAASVQAATHGFGLRPTSLPVTRWPALVEQWLGSIGMVRNN
ncbi:hypothetical protein E7V67_022555 [[Empedobacter] haloabium]|uniref:Uncharacterized protein n=1 Tax=[Empedobacter] haloabium TaxID=592317 RepID=A0ABZ1UIW4_9BURK